MESQSASFTGGGGAISRKPGAGIASDAGASAQLLVLVAIVDLPDGAQGSRRCAELLLELMQSVATAHPTAEMQRSHATRFQPPDRLPDQPRSQTAALIAAADQMVFGLVSCHQEYRNRLDASMLARAQHQRLGTGHTA